VANLDADKLDGLDSTAFALQSAFADHSTRHESGGADAIKLDDLSAPDDNTDLNATTSAHGLSPKATAPASGLLSVLAIGNGATVRSDTAIFDTTNPAALGTAGPGTQLVAARRDHIHTLPKLDDLATPDDNTDLDASTSAHGLLKKLPGGTTTFLRADGSFATAGKVDLLLSASGTDTTATATTVSSVATGALTAKDRLWVLIQCESATQQTAAPTIYNVTDSVKVADINTGSAITAAQFLDVEAVINQRVAGSTSITTSAAFDHQGSSAITRTGSTWTTAWTTGITIGLRHGGVTSGGTFSYSWAVYALRGQ
jgi:hypothetical protein